MNGQAPTRAVLALASMAAVVISSGDLMASDQPLPQPPCIGFDNQFDTAIPGINDFLLISESGCPEPGVQWFLRSCETGESLSARVVYENTDGVRVEMLNEIGALRAGYREKADIVKLAEIEADLLHLGLVAQMRQETSSSDNLPCPNRPSEDGAKG